jgi:hypothetical protein
MNSSCLTTLRVFQSGPNKLPEKRVRAHGTRFKFGVKLTAQEPRVILEFDNLNQTAIRGKPTENQPLFHQGFLEIHIKLIPMAVTFEYFILVITLIGPGTLD